MAVSAVSMRYVKALFAASGKSGEAASVLSHLNALDQVLSTSAELVATLRNPRVDAAGKRKILDSIGLDQAPAVLRDFIALCLDRGRAETILEAGEEFRRLDREARNVLVARVQSVAPLAESTREAVKAKLEEATGKTVELHEEIDAALVGGIRIFIGSTMWDGSVRRQLDDIEHHLTAAP